jgi:hypothetical protein
MIWKLVVATVLVAMVFGGPAAVLFALAGFAALRLLGVPFDRPGKFERPGKSATILLAPPDRGRGAPMPGAADKALFDKHFDSLLRWTARADRLCNIAAGRRRTSEASRVADVLQAACDRLLQMRISFDDVGDGIAIRKSIAWAQSAVTILRRDLPEEHPGRRAMEGALDIAYVDDTGRRTERYLEARSIEAKDGQLYLWAWCEKKQAVGKFRVDRIAALADGETGEIVAPHLITRWLLERASGSLVPA